MSGKETVRQESEGQKQTHVVQEISGGQHDQTYMGGVCGQYIHTQLNQVIGPGTTGSSLKPQGHASYSINFSLTVHEDQPISLQSGIFNATLHSAVTGDRKAAVKITPAEKKNYREAKIHFLVPHHKNIVERIATDIFNLRGQPSIFIAMERCDCNLYAHITKEAKDGVPFNSEKYIWIAYQIVEGLDFLHLYRVIHADCKPGNILLILDGNIVKLSDFGLSKNITDGKSATVLTSPQAGTMGWLAPEIIEGVEKISTATDIFPCGLVFYFVWSHGKHAYGDQLYALNHHIVEGTNQDLSQLLILDLADIAEALLKRMLNKDPAQRPTTKEILQNAVFHSQNDQAKKVDNTKVEEASGPVARKVDRPKLPPVSSIAIPELETVAKASKSVKQSKPEDVVPQSGTLWQQLNVDCKFILLSVNKEDWKHLNRLVEGITIRQKRSIERKFIWTGPDYGPEPLLYRLTNRKIGQKIVIVTYGAASLLLDRALDKDNLEIFLQSEGFHGDGLYQCITSNLAVFALQPSVLVRKKYAKTCVNIELTKAKSDESLPLTEPSEENSLCQKKFQGAWDGYHPQLEDFISESNVTAFIKKKVHEFLTEKNF